MAQNILELKLLSGSSPHSMPNKELSHLKGKKKELKVDYAQLPASPASGRSQNSLPQPFKR